MAGDDDLQLWELGEDALAGWGTSKLESGFEGYHGSGDSQSFSITVAVPEPGTPALFLSGVLMFAGRCVVLRRQR